MKIAFTSCTCAGFISNQPVWDSIRLAKPDHVVLLGDNIYNDVPSPGIAALQQMTDLEFAVHTHARYVQQLANPQFRALVADPDLTVHAIWDDHDFAWDNAEGGELLRNPVQAGKVKIATSLMREFRRVLKAKDLSLFAASANDPAVWADTQANAFRALGASSIALEDNGRSWLHLTDGRTERRKKTMLGITQRNQLKLAFEKYPDALHIIASGGTFSHHDCWANYPTDYTWLKNCIGDRRWLMLSGDVHVNNQMDHPLEGGGCLVEATSSGAGSVAYLNPLYPGAELRNHGLLELTDNRATLTLASFGETIGSPVNFARRPGGDLGARHAA